MAGKKCLTDQELYEIFYVDESDVERLPDEGDDGWETDSSGCPNGMLSIVLSEFIAKCIVI